MTCTDSHCGQIGTAGTKRVAVQEKKIFNSDNRID